MTSMEIYPILIQDGDLHEHACTKILRVEFLRKNGLSFKEGILGEDTEWMFRILRLNSAIILSDVQLYIYTESREGSIVNTASTRSVRDAISTIRSSIEYYEANPTVPTREFELAHCSYIWSIALGLYRNVPKEDRGVIKTELKVIKKHLNLKAHPKSRKVWILYLLLGFDITSLILSKYISLHKKNLVNKKKKISDNGN